VSYWDAFELSYQLYDAGATGHGHVTEAVQLMVDYLFGAKTRLPQMMGIREPGNGS
jgi:[ribosomal protein S5]-alanine N-acetyltransferase